MDEVTETEEDVKVRSFYTPAFKIRVGRNALQSFQDKLKNLKPEKQAYAERFIDAWLYQKIRAVKKEDAKKIPIVPKFAQFEADFQKFKKRLFSAALEELKKQKRLEA